MTIEFDPAPVGMDGRSAEGALIAIGAVLRSARQDKNMTIDYLADLCGISDSVVCRVELGRRPPTFVVLYRLCAHLGLQLSDVFRTIEAGADRLPVTDDARP